MKYKEKVERTIELELEAGDVVEWRDEDDETEWLRFVVTKTTEGFIHGICFEDNRRNYGQVIPVPRPVRIATNKYLYRLRKLEEKDWWS